jgi:tRNA G37 N-methylase Trm5
VIAGIHSTETEVVQHGTRFKLDFAKVAIAWMTVWYGFSSSQLTEN